MTAKKFNPPRAVELVDVFLAFAGFLALDAGAFAPMLLTPVCDADLALLRFVLLELALTLLL